MPAGRPFPAWLGTGEWYLHLWHCDSVTSLPASLSSELNLQFLRLHPALLLCLVVLLGSGSMGANNKFLPCLLVHVGIWSGLTHKASQRWDVLLQESTAQHSLWQKCIKEMIQNGKTIPNPPPKSSQQRQGCSLLLCEWESDCGGTMSPARSLW